MNDRLDPDIRRFIDTVNADWRRHPPLAGLPIEQARKVAEQVRQPWTAGGPAMAETRDIAVVTKAGRIRLRIHRPAGVAPTSAPALIYLHGGGFVFFSLDTHDRLMREYAERGGFVVIGVDYPLSPEAKYPVALNHVVALVHWLDGHGPALGIDPARMAIGGDSAGANLAFATCLRLRDAGGDGVPLRAILSNYGAFSGRCSEAAEAAYGGPAAVLSRDEMIYYFDRYLGDPAQLDDPYACPLVADDMTGLPPMFLVIPEFDVLTEQSLVMLDRLRGAGGDVDGKVYPGTTHSFLEAMSIASISRAAIDDGADWLRDRLA